MFFCYIAAVLGVHIPLSNAELGMITQRIPLNTQIMTTIPLEKSMQPSQQLDMFYAQKISLSSLVTAHFQGRGRTKVVNLENIGLNTLHCQADKIMVGLKRLDQALLAHQTWKQGIAFILGHERQCGLGKVFLAQKLEFKGLVVVIHFKSFSLKQWLLTWQIQRLDHALATSRVKRSPPGLGFTLLPSRTMTNNLFQQQRRASIPFNINYDESKRAAKGDVIVAETHDLTLTLVDSYVVGNIDASFTVIGSSKNTTPHFMGVSRPI